MFRFPDPHRRATNDGRRQLDPGSYEVFREAGSSSKVGAVFVEGTAGSSVTEHWVLFDSWSSPTGSVKHIVKEKPGTGWASKNAFLDAMEDLEQAEGPLTYAESICTISAGLPS